VMFSWNNVDVNIYGVTSQLVSPSDQVHTCSSREKYRDSTAWRTDDVPHAFLKAVFCNRWSLLVQISASAQSTAHEYAQGSTLGQINSAEKWQKRRRKSTSKEESNFALSCHPQR
jgi:hypothetical protein